LRKSLKDVVDPVSDVIDYLFEPFGLFDLCFEKLIVTIISASLLRVTIWNIFGKIGPFECLFEFLNLFGQLANGSVFVLNQAYQFCG
jgi:hypothetical protein